MNILRKNLLPILSLAAGLTLVSCGDDDDNNTTDPGPITSDFTLTIENVSPPKDFFMSGIFNTPTGSDGPGPIADGGSYEFSFYAGPSTLPMTSTKLSFATMLIKSNDLFFAPDGGGIALYDESGNAVTGDVTDQITLWDAGTEVNQEPGTGSEQPMNGSGSTAENGNVVEIPDGTMDAGGFSYPDAEDLIQVTISNPSPAFFTVTITNVSGDSDLDGPFSPGVWVVHTSDNPLFEEGAADQGNGLEDIAESGDPSSLGSFLADNTGTVVPLSPGAWATHIEGATPLFTAGAPDTKGIEGIAEDGDPTDLAASLSADVDVISSGIFNTPVGADGAGPIGPGGKYEISFTATQGEYFNFSTMFIQSNDLFYAFGEGGLALWGSDGNAISGDVTSEVSLWDSGTEVNEFPGAGLNQAIRQSAANTGTDENGNVRLVDDNFTYADNDQVIKVTITSN